MPTIPPDLTPAPTPYPVRNDRTTFSGRVDAFVTWLIVAIGQLAALGSNVYANAVSAFNSAAAALASANAAAASESNAGTSASAAASSAVQAANSAAAVRGRLSKSVAGSSDVTLTEAEASNLFIEFTGALTGNINVIVPAAIRLFAIYNATSGAFTLTVKTAAGTGVAVKQAGRMFLECDSVNVTNPNFGCDANFGDVVSTGKLLVGAGNGNVSGLSSYSQTIGIYGSSAATTSAAGIQFGDNNSASSRQWAIYNGRNATEQDIGKLNFVVSGSVNTDALSGTGVLALSLTASQLTVAGSVVVATSLSVGDTSSGTASAFTSSYGANAGSAVLSAGGTENALVAYVVTGGGLGNAANSAVKVNKDNTTSRSINSAGTINASGADYAEYENNNGLVIAKGEIVGFKSDGTLTDKLSESVRFGIKSTNPSYVGGDTWGSHNLIGVRPIKPEFISPDYIGAENPGELKTIQPVEPVLNLPAKPVLQDGETEEVLAMRIANWQQTCGYIVTAHESALAQYPSILAEWQTAKAAHDAAQSQYEADLAIHTAAVAAAQVEFDTITMPVYEVELATFNANLEAARQNVDRIAYSGKVPVNVAGCTPGGYVIAAQGAGDTIIGLFVIDPDFTEYKKAVGRVNRILKDGRAEVAVMIH